MAFSCSLALLQDWRQNGGCSWPNGRLCALIPPMEGKLCPSKETSAIAVPLTITFFVSLFMDLVAAVAFMLHSVWGGLEAVRLLTLVTLPVSGQVGACIL
eukprot:6087599-Ditylum_brightwellii.AAC.1